MLFDLPSPEILYDALLARDERYDGRVFVCVTTTGIFCRLSCPARKPKFENCRFHDSAAACIERGFRPCLRCRPLTSMIGEDPVLARLLTALEAEPERRWTEADVAALGLDPSTVRRSFRRNFGITFLEMARHARIRAGMQALKTEGRVIDAQVSAGFDSPSAFREAVARLLGCAPAALRGEARLRIDWIGTPLGPMVAVTDEHALHLLEFVERKALASELKALVAASPGGLQVGRFTMTDRVEAELERFFAGRDARFTVPISQPGSAFAQAVWAALREIPAGETRSYGAIADALGRPSAVRAVARANGANRIAVVVPCHRVIGADGSLTGYGGGLWRKQRLIELERGYLEIAATRRAALEPSVTPP
ncbi:bifunctional transcriptional activator/DNA repair enzyme AdaA [Salinarimonas ramus]|nr:trifunctional transcriptional activator/DNA repair protein Ada/methylated-DNA--[protein]-cysteine S-methyltransferase [Salinarimonas ramus]